MKANNEQITYLDNMRSEKTISMFDAAPFLMRDFNLDYEDAIEILSDWMEQLTDECPVEH